MEEDGDVIAPSTLSLSPDINLHYENLSLCDSAPTPRFSPLQMWKYQEKFFVNIYATRGEKKPRSCAS